RGAGRPVGGTPKTLRAGSRHPFRARSPDWIAPGHQRGCTSPVHRTASAVLSSAELVDARRLDIGTVKPDVLPPQVLSNDGADVGGRWTLLARRRSPVAQGTAQD